jgi:hypothetical protein
VEEGATYKKLWTKKKWTESVDAFKMFYTQALMEIRES